MLLASSWHTVYGLRVAVRNFADTLESQEKRTKASQQALIASVNAENNNAAAKPNMPISVRPKREQNSLQLPAGINVAATTSLSVDVAAPVTPTDSAFSPSGGGDAASAVSSKTHTIIARQSSNIGLLNNNNGGINSDGTEGSVSAVPMSTIAAAVKTAAVAVRVTPLAAAAGPATNAAVSSASTRLADLRAASSKLNKLNILINFILIVGILDNITNMVTIASGKIDLTDYAIQDPSQVSWLAFLYPLFQQIAITTLLWYSWISPLPVLSSQLRKQNGTPLILTLCYGVGEDGACARVEVNKYTLGSQNGGGSGGTSINGGSTGNGNNNLNNTNGESNAEPKSSMQLSFFRQSSLPVMSQVSKTEGRDKIQLNDVNDSTATNNGAVSIHIPAANAVPGAIEEEE